MTLPIGHLLVDMGVLTEQQRAWILEEQKLTGRPFGDLAEEMFGVDPRSVEKAWSSQYASTTRWIDPTIEHIDPAVVGLISRRQAWQFKIVPIRYEGSELMVATSVHHLVRALNFATKVIPANCYFVLAEPEALGDALVKYYPMEGMNRNMVASDWARPGSAAA
jgi:hypothetical protein